MALQIFDMDIDLQESPETKDLTDVYNEDAVNQSIDLFVTYPYRISKGLTNRIFTKIFSDLTFKTETDIIRDIEDEFEENYPLLELNNVEVERIPNLRKLKIKIDWKIRGYELSGTYKRYWES